jgi:hypothetical protein
MFIKVIFLLFTTRFQKKEDCEQSLKVLFSILEITDEELYEKL